MFHNGHTAARSGNAEVVKMLGFSTRKPKSAAGPGFAPIALLEPREIAD
jgi:hypothetical protein